MAILALREEVHKYIDMLDEQFLRIVHSMLSTHAKETGKIVGFDAEGNPRYAEALWEKLDKKVRNVEKDEFVAVEDINALKRKFGLGKHLISEISDDFNEPLPHFSDYTK